MSYNLARFFHILLSAILTNPLAPPFLQFFPYIYVYIYTIYRTYFITASSVLAALSDPIFLISLCLSLSQFNWSFSCTDFDVCAHSASRTFDPQQQRATYCRRHWAQHCHCALTPLRSKRKQLQSGCCRRRQSRRCHLSLLMRFLKREDSKRISLWWPGRNTCAQWTSARSA